MNALLTVSTVHSCPREMRFPPKMSSSTYVFLFLSILITKTCARCSSDADCVTLAPNGRAICQVAECSCKEGFAEQHTFDASGNKKEVHCHWPTPVWFWAITHFVTFLSPFILSGSFYLIYSWCTECCSPSGAADSSDSCETVPIANRRRK